MPSKVNIPCPGLNGEGCKYDRNIQQTYEPESGGWIALDHCFMCEREEVNAPKRQLALQQAQHNKKRRTTESLARVAIKYQKSVEVHATAIEAASKKLQESISASQLKIGALNKPIPNLASLYTIPASPLPSPNPANAHNPTNMDIENSQLANSITRQLNQTTLTSTPPNPFRQ
eukprot:Phypoly_transcript_17284.p1 GENE.Phypoly_transcript_17284~~Phypoly_transcript_17284.p1  ORF type:complete len:174 (+),score=34.97 Phypoly_transcript_17284:31-552(+)